MTFSFSEWYLEVIIEHSFYEFKPLFGTSLNRYGASTRVFAKIAQTV